MLLLMPQLESLESQCQQMRTRQPQGPAGLAGMWPSDWLSGAVRLWSVLGWGYLTFPHCLCSRLPVARSAHGATVYSDKLWIFAGYDGNAR